MIQPDFLLLTSAREYTKSGNFPYSINIVPFNFGGSRNRITDLNPLTIEYDWGDGFIDKIQYKINDQRNFGNFTKISNLNPPIALQNPAELGSPVNYAANHVYYADDKSDFSISKRFNIKITTTFFGTSAITVQNVNLFLRKMDIIPQSNSLGYFRDITLLKTRMYGANNTMLYTFESKSPNWILMSTVNWNLKEEKNQNITILPPVRPYKYLLPFEDRFTSLVPLNSSIETIRIAKRGNIGVNVIDRGGGGL